MNSVKVKSLVVVGFASFTLVWASPSSAQEQQIELCQPGQTYEIHYVCDHETRQCVVVWEGCV